MLCRKFESYILKLWAFKIKGHLLVYINSQKVLVVASGPLSVTVVISMIGEGDIDSVTV